MSLSDIAIKRPIATLMVFIAILIVGMFSLFKLSIDLLPDVEFPSLSVSTVYEGASPKEVEVLITEPIERAVSTVQNVQEVRSTSNEGSSSVSVTFKWGTDMKEATNDIRDRVGRVRGALPENALDPSIWKFDASSMPIINLGLSGTMPLDKIRKYADDDIKYRFERIEGVAAVDVGGGLEREIHIDVDQSQMEGVGLSFNQIISTLGSENLDVPGGYLKTPRKELLVRTSGQYTSVAQIANTVVGRQNGAPIYLRQIADVKDSFKELRSETLMRGQPGVNFSIQKQPGENTVKVANRVLKELKNVKASLPEGMDIFVTRDSSKFIKDSIKQIEQTAMIGGVLAIFILFVFLQSVRSTLILSVSIPLAVVATFILMNFAGLTLNMMSMGGLALGIGMLLDNSIVVLENIYRHRQWGEDPEQSASVGTKEVASAITASTMTTLCVFLPLLFAGTGMQGIFFGQLAYTVSFSVLCSLFVALTLIPVMSLRLLKVVPMSEMSGQSNPKGFAKFEHFMLKRLDALNNKYRNSLDWVLDHRKWVIIVCLLILVLCLALIPTIGTEFMPEVDEGLISVNLELPVGTKLEVTDELTTKLDKMIRDKVPELDTIRTNIGGGGFGGGGSPNAASININLVDKSKRKRSTNDVMTDLRRILSGNPDTKVWVSSRGSMMTRMLRGGQSSRLEVDVRGHDLEKAAVLAEQVKELVENVPGTVNVRVSRAEGKPELTVLLDRDKASNLGLNLANVANTLNTSLTGAVATRYREGGDEFDVRIRLKERDRMSLDNAKSVFVNTGTNSSVTLGNIAKVQEAVGPISIERRAQERTITVSSDMLGRDPGSIGKDINAKLTSLNVPEGFSVRFVGEQEEQKKANRSLMFVLMLAVALVYMVMAAQYESLLHPFVIMFAIPFAAIGVTLMLFFTGTNFSINVFIGVIMLAGIVVNNAIVLVDYINLMRRQGMDLREAILEGGRRRLRPILMTTLVTVFGLLPMALGIGSGAELQASMARTVFGGMTVATVFTLFFVPTIYYIFESIREKRKGRLYD